MHYAIVTGKVVASQKAPMLEGQALKVVQPCSDEGEPFGEPIVAVDPIGAREFDLVIWVAKREASLAIADAPLKNLYPIDAAITGIVDDIS